MDWENVSWVFSGIGSTVISIIVGAICGGVAGYRIGIKKTTIKQTQKNRGDGNQVQIGNQEIKH